MRYFPIVCLSVLVLTVPVSCNRNDSGLSTDVTIRFQTKSMAVPAAGGTFSIEYTVYGGVDDYEVEAVCPETWIGGWTYGDGEITFNVDPNTGGSRQAVVNILCDGEEDGVSFTVIQADPTQISESELDNTVWMARICQFYRDETIFQEVNPEINSEIYSSYITAGEFADQYASDWNRDNPDNLITPDDAIYWEYTSPDAVNPEYVTYFTVRFQNGGIEVSYGMETVAGGAAVTNIAGKYDFDESTGIMTVADTLNQLYDREVIIQLTRDGDELVYEVLRTWNPGYLAEYFGCFDSFGMVLSNYNGTKCYKPHGRLEYHLIYAGENVDEQTDN